MMGRKRKRSGKGGGGDEKRQKVASVKNSKEPIVKEALLAHYYQEVLTLREFVLSKLPPSSKVRRKKILSVGKKSLQNDEEDEERLSSFLDQTLVGISSKRSEQSARQRWQQWTTFSQRSDDSVSTLATLNGPPRYSQSEIVDFSVWLLFSKGHASNGKNNHLLCQGFKKEVSVRSIALAESSTSPIPGVVSMYPNYHVTSMKAHPWPRVLALLGKEGERAMVDLILDCGIFLPLETGQGLFQQLSGQPLGDMTFNSRDLPRSFRIVKDGQEALRSTVRSPGDINFVRNRMMYARAALNAHGGVHFGYRHIHVLNRYPLVPRETKNNECKEVIHDIPPSTIQIMLYMFPRQFGLHNPFTNDVDTRQTVQPFQDYTLREDEIHKKFPGTKAPKIPKRLRNQAAILIQKLQVRHSKCAYKKLLNHYCPVPNRTRESIPDIQPNCSNESTKLKTQDTIATAQTASLNSPTVIPPPRRPSMMDFASPTSMVSAFCRAVISNLVPCGFWGVGDTRTHNEKNFLHNIDRFIKLRRFENLSLHEVSQGMKIGGIEWLGPPQSPNNKLSQSDFNKRWEIFHEFLYYVFDSLLIPLIRANFHVTESNVHRYRIFYFRHDVWKTLAEPALASLKNAMFEEIKLERAIKVLDSRSLGYSQVRLLPKETGIRPILNLRRRALKGGSNYLGSSINSILAPVYNAFTYEKNNNPGRLGSTLFAVGDLYAHLKTFKSCHTPSNQGLYFAKVDVKAAFDTIPQSAILKLMSAIPTESEYRISKHVEIKPGENYRSDKTTRPVRKFISLAHNPDDLDSFNEKVESDLGIGRKNTIFVDNIVNQFKNTGELLHLLAEHVNNNMVKIGKRFYRQKEGIPQGSILSSLLCNYFYADLEAKHLSFLQSEDTLLLRLIDDFLLITSNRQHAKEFLQVMHDGLPDFGVGVNPDKTLVNFEAQINGKKVKRLVGTDLFPYCGSYIDTKTLDITRDRERKKDMDVGDSLTVEYSKVPGKTFHRKVLNTFKIQAHAMFLDTRHNSLHTVLTNIYSAFVEAAIKMWRYARFLPIGKQPGTRLLIKTISDLQDLAFILMKSKGRNKKNAAYKCAVNKVQVEWLALTAFNHVLKKRQSKYTKTLGWIEERIWSLSTSRKHRDAVSRLKRVVATTTKTMMDD